jgi:flagellar basal body-associated protein FliL
MSKKEIITLVVACSVLGIAIYFIVTLLFPNNNTSNQNVTQNTNTQTVPAELNDTTYKTVNTLSDYGKPDLSGLGKSDLFAGF